MPLIGRSQTNSAIDQNIKDALQRQNTAAIMRAVLKVITENYFNRVDDLLPVEKVEGLQELLDLLSFIPIEENEAGTIHPAFEDQHALNLFLLANIGGGNSLPQAQLADEMIIDTQNKTVDFTLGSY